MTLTTGNADIIKTYLDLIISDDVGMLSGQDFSVDSKALLNMFDISKDKQTRIKTNFIQGEYRHILGEDYNCLPYDSLSYFIALTPACFKSFLINSNAAAAMQIKK